MVSTRADLSRPLFESAARDLGWRLIWKLLEADNLDIDGDADYVYLRDPFTSHLAWPEIRSRLNPLFTPKRRLVDNLTTTEDLLMEDKWRQFKRLGSLMPPTEILQRPAPGRIIKRRVSCRSAGIYLTDDNLPGEADEYITQPLLNIEREYRVVSVGGEILSQAAVKQSHTATTPSKVISAELVPAAVRAVAAAADRILKYDLVGYDIAIVTGVAQPVLLEANRSPQISAYQQVTGLNVAERLFRYLDTPIALSH